MRYHTTAAQHQDAVKTTHQQDSLASPDQQPPL